MPPLLILLLGLDSETAILHYFSLYTFILCLLPPLTPDPLSLITSELLHGTYFICIGVFVSASHMLYSRFTNFWAAVAIYLLYKPVKLRDLRPQQSYSRWVQVHDPEAEEEKRSGDGVCRYPYCFSPLLVLQLLLFTHQAGRQSCCWLCVQ